MKKLLIITYYWPPAGGPGVQRWVKFSKYLSKLGYQCYVVTVDEQYASYPSTDTSLEKDIDASIKVTKTKSFEVLKIFSSLFKKEKVPYAGIPDKNKISFVGKVALYIRSNFFIPDARVGWNRYALKACEQIIEKENIDVVISTSPPHSTQLVGLALKKKYKHLKWIADLRDPWTDIYYYGKLSHTAMAKQKDLNLEKQVLEMADTVTVTSPITAELYAGKISKAMQHKIKTITNGFDEDDFTASPSSVIQEGRGGGVFTITFAGTINEQFGIEAFVLALKSIVENHKNVLLHFVGTFDKYTKELLEKEIPQHHKITAYVPHKELMRYLMQSQVLLLAIPKGNNQGTIPGKLFEYLATKKTIICLGPKNCAAGTIIAECAAGKTFEHEALNEMEIYLQELIASFNAGVSISVQSDVYKKYARKELAKQYAGVIEGK